MTFRVTNDNVLYLYDYYSYSEKADEMSKKVYSTFKKDSCWYYDEILEEFCSALENWPGIEHLKNVCVALVPSHTAGTYGGNLQKIATDICEKYDMVNYSNIISRIITKQKSTDGGERSESAHLKTLQLNPDVTIDTNDIIFILDDITTTGSSLSAAKTIICNEGLASDRVFKIAFAETKHTDDI